MPRLAARTFVMVLGLLSAHAGFSQSPGALKVFPNLETNIDRPLRYRPDGADFVIENGAEFFNRPLYGGNTAFRVDGGDKPEFVLYLPGRGGNLRLGLRGAAGTKWLHTAEKITARYRPGELLYEIRDPLLGEGGVLRVTAIALHQTEGLIVRAEGEAISPGVELIWAYGGVNGQRGTRDGDIGTERVPISEWFQLKPEFCRDNAITIDAGGFTLRAKAATIAGVMPAGATLKVADATKWDAWDKLAAAPGGQPGLPVVIGHVAIEKGEPVFLSLQRIATNAAPAEDLGTYREVGAPQPAAKSMLLPLFARADLPRVFAETEKHFAELRGRVSVETPDAFLNAAVGALNVAADAVWDEPQHDIMHGAIAWRTRLLGWRGPYALDALGWHERARSHFEYWAGRQNVSPIPEKIPAASEKDNLARNEAGLHSNGDLSNSHYDMNLVAIDALFRHLRWTGDREFAQKMWPVIERHLAWERRLFRREFVVNGEKLPLYEAYAAIWASDDLQYSGGGTAHASAYNYFHNREAARLARWLNLDSKIYETEAVAIERAMRSLLWVQPDGGGGWFAESKDWLGAQLVHPSAALWTFYHTMDSEVPTPQEAWTMSRYVDEQIPHLPVRGPGVPGLLRQGDEGQENLVTLAESNWMPYDWSINNVVMGEAVHAALGFWQAGRADEAWRIAKGSLLAAMFMGISPGNVGSMSYLDVYRRESQRDFGDGSGVLSRALVEGLFGVRPDALAGELRIEPGWPGEWEHAALRHPDVAVSFQRSGLTDRYVVTQGFAKSLALRLRLRARTDRIARVTVDGVTANWHVIENSVGLPRIDVLASAVAKHEIAITWEGANIASGDGKPGRKQQGQMRWVVPAEARRALVELPGVHRMTVDGRKFDSVALSSVFNDRVTQIFKNEYRTPRSPFVSLALPKQGLGGWAGGVNATAEIDDTGLRAWAAKDGGKISLPNGVVFATPGEPGAKNILFVSQWDNYPREATIPLSGRASGAELLMAGSTNPMQSRIDNGEVIVTYTDGTTARLPLANPETWWPIEQDYFIDQYQFRYTGGLPPRVDLKTGKVRVLESQTFVGTGGKIPGGAATVLELPLDPAKELKSLTVRALANDVVIGLMAATLVR